jgi:catechol 2,3-dioxygenase-like lactoylglutathione lyase family enzyme
MTIKSLAHVCIKTTDLEATAKFYCGTLGLKRFFNFTRKGKVIGFYMKAANETFVEVFLEGEIEKIGKQPLNHFCLETDSIEALRKKVLESGYEAREIHLGADNSYQFWMKDPNGMDMEFHQYTDKSSQFTGQDVEANW